MAAEAHRTTRRTNRESQGPKDMALTNARCGLQGCRPVCGTKRRRLVAGPATAGAGC